MPAAIEHDVEPAGAVEPTRHAVHAMTAPAVAVYESAGQLAHVEEPAKYCPPGHVFIEEHDWRSGDAYGNGEVHCVHDVAPDEGVTESAAQSVHAVAVDGDDEKEPIPQA